MDYRKLHLSAFEAGITAAEKAKVDMIMAVDVFTGKRSDPFPICGFAWVKFPGNTAWGRWAKTNGLARKAYPTGLSYWISGYGQSHDLKAAFARGYAECLKANGIEAYADSRLD